MTKILKPVYAIPFVIAALWPALAHCATPASLSDIQAKAIAATGELKAKAMQTLRALAQGDGYKVLGLSGSNDAQSAQLGQPIPIFDIDSAALAAYHQGDDPSSLLTNCDRVVYPVVVGDDVKSSITMYKSKSGVWAPGSFGRSATAKSLVQAANAFEVANPGKAAFIAVVPSQNTYVKGNLGAGGVEQLEILVVGAPNGPSDGRPGGLAPSRGPAPSGLSVIDQLSRKAKAQAQSSGRGVR